MSTILVIADQPRLQQIVTSACDGLPAIVRFAGGLDRAGEVQCDFPEILLIQDRLSGLSGEILARHLRALFPASMVSVALLTDEPRSSEGKRFIDRCVDVRLSDADFVLAVRKFVVERLEIGTADSGNRAEPGVGEPSGESDLQVCVSQSPQPEPQAAINSPFRSSLENAINDQSPMSIPIVEHEQELENKQRQAAEGLLGSTTKQRRLGWIYLAVFLILAATLYIFIGGRSQPPKKAAARPSSPPASPAKQAGIARLPSIVPIKGLDSSYGTKHPGWERYTDSSNEFKIYREKGAILALQIIDHSGKGLSPSSIEKVLQETTGAKGYEVLNTSTKEGYVVAKGTAAGIAKILIYKSRSDQQIRGMVLHLD